MNSRLLSTVLALTMALAGLGWGAWRLGTIFVAERDEARAAAEGRRRTLEQYAIVALEHVLRGRLDGVKGATTRAANDPIVVADGLYLRRHGRQLLPRVPSFRPGTATPARALFERLAAGAPPAGAPADPTDPWAERLRLRAAFLGVLADGPAEAVAARFRALLGHRARQVLPPAHEIPLALSTLEAFVARGAPAPALLRDLLRDGLEDPRGLRVEGLMRLLLRATDAFTEADHAFLASRLLALAERAGVGQDAFRARLGDRGSTLPVPAVVERPLLVRGADARLWYVQAVSEGEVRGVGLTLPAAVDAVVTEMRARGLLGADETLAAGWPAASPERVSVETRRLEPRLRSARLAASVRRADAALQLKTGLLAVCVVLALLLVAGLGLEQSRRQRFVELKSDFVATVSHELRTPLASIRVQAETLAMRLEGDPRAGDYPDRIVQDVDGLTFLVENVLSFNRLDKGRWVARSDRVRVASVLEAVRDHLAAMVAAPVEWQSEVAPELEVQADAELLQLLLLNLARNGCQYNERNPVRLHVAATEDAGWVHLDVSDNGVGIDDAARRHIFTAFWRAPGATRRGSGLGLAICRRVARLHGGRIELLQTGDQGSTFRVSLRRVKR